MNLIKTGILFLFISFTQSYAMKNNSYENNDTLVLKGHIIQQNMTNKKGQKMEDIHDLYFVTGTDTYFIKIAGSKYLRKELERLTNSELTVKVVRKFGNLDIDSDDPSYAQTRMGEYIVILEIIKTN